MNTTMCHSDLITYFKEANILAMLKHVNIIEFYGACNQPGNFSLVIELAPYGSLYNFLQKEKGFLFESIKFEYFCTFECVGDA